MARLPNISKYCVVRRSAALASSNEYTIDTPSIGRCTVPFTDVGCGSSAASSAVGATSMTWWNCERISPLALMPVGQWTTIPLRVPPKWEATCLVHWNGVLPASAQPMEKCGKVIGPPHWSIRLSCEGTSLTMPFSATISL